MSGTSSNATRWPQPQVVPPPRIVNAAPQEGHGVCTRGERPAAKRMKLKLPSGSVAKSDIGYDEGAEPVDPSIGTWLMSAKSVLLADGFKRDLKQFRKPGQVWGVIRQEPDDMQIHVRAFTDGRLESEVELSNKYVQHLWSHRRNAHAEVTEILAKHGLPTQHVSETFVPITGSKEGKIMPSSRTKNHHVAMSVAVGIGILLGRQYVKRLVLRALPRGSKMVVKKGAR